MSRHRVLLLVLPSVLGPLALSLSPPAHAQVQPVPQPQGQVQAQGISMRPEHVVARALQANPLTSPYQIAVTWTGTKVALSGRVGSSDAHRMAVRTVIDLGYPVRDDLVTDTAEGYRTISPSNSAPPMTLGTRPWIAAPGMYPPPLFGFADNPFFGFEPPILSYPPWWGNLSAGRLQIGPTASPANPLAQADPASAPIPPGTIEMSINQRGVATLRGTVPTLGDKIAVGQRIAQEPGVSEVQNLLQIDPKMARPAAVTPQADAAAAPPPPFPPQPNPPNAPLPDQAQVPDRPPAREGPAIAAGDLTERLTQTFARRPALAGLPVRVSVRDGVATLSGKVPTVYEAMLAYRAVQQTPGVRAIDDRLEFVVPDGEKTNPLLNRGRPEDVEPYLTAQLQRQVGDLAHVDQIRLQGDVLEIRGTLLRGDDRPRLDAILRSIPILRGFQVEPKFVADDL